jgi:diguanylate cyclase (GGDEF)-like protein/PAS domain S-box-containing protein
MSLKNRLFVLIISISTISLLVSSYITLNMLDGLFSTHQMKNINHDKKIINNLIDTTKLNLKQFAHTIAQDKNIIALLQQAAEPQEKNKENLKIEERIKNVKLIRTVTNYSFYIFDNNKKQIFLNDEMQQLNLTNFNKNSDINKFQISFENDIYSLTYSTNVILNNEIIGYVQIGFDIGNKFLIDLNQKLDTQIILKLGESYLFENKVDQENFKQIQFSEDYILKNYTLISTKTPLEMVFIINQKELNKQLQIVYLRMFSIWIFILFITFLVSFRFVNKSIVNPLKELKESIKNIKNDKYEEITIDKYDEISIIKKDFNKLSKTLKDNISFLNSYKSVMDEGSIVTKSDLKGNITYANDNFYKVSGYSKNETIGSPHSIVRDPQTPKSVFENLWKTIQSKNVWKGILKNRKKDGSFYWVDIAIQPIVNSKNEIIEYIAVRHEITELIKQREKLDSLVNKDLLTNLGNRFKLSNDIRKNSKNSIAILNVDNFRQVNDFYGHAFGDKLIQKLSEILSSLIASQKQYELYRLQGDEFVILGHPHSNDLFYERIKNILNFIDNDNIEVETEQLSVKLTAAISFESNDKILQTADMALQIARKKNIDIVIYNEENSLNKEYENNLKWTKKIKEAIEENRVVPFFQPIVNNSNNSYEKYESLIRIIEDDKVISPYFFLEISKKTKYYNILTKIMLEKSFKKFYNNEFEFSVNLTIDDILNVEIQDYIFELLNKYGIGKRVVFEIVESESIENFNQVVSFIKNVKAFGCKIAIDDFGTGYSNFEYLMKLEADYIKIDGSMIKNIDTDNNAKMVVETIVNFAKKMNMKTIAEFVENEEILKIVNELGIEYSQGYYFSAPKQELE